MPKERIITREQFDELLAWLDPDREAAGVKYESLRRSLIRIFTWRGFYAAEDMADETFNRVAQNVLRVKPTFVGEPMLYVYSVANNLAMEYARRKKSWVPLEEVSDKLRVEDDPEETERAQDRERADECLSRCLQLLEPHKREMILAYYEREKQAKIDYRKVLADQENIDLNTLRVRVHRLRAGLEKCIHKCLEQFEDEDRRAMD